MAACQRSKATLGAEDYPGFPTEVGPAVRKSLTTESMRDKARDALMQAGLDGTLKEAITSVFSTPRACGDGEEKKADDNKANDNKTAFVPMDDENEKGEKLTELFFAHPCPAVSEHDSYKLELLERLTGIGMKAEHAKRLRVALREGSTIVEIFGPSLLKADMQALPLRNVKMRGCGAMLSRKELEEHAICEQLPPASEKEQSETELRDAVMAALETGATNGNLEGFLKGLNAQLSDHELENLCPKAQQFLLAAAKDGRLADALGAAQKAIPKAADMGKDEDLHTLVQSTPAQACTNGKLETAFREDNNSIIKDKGQKQAGASATGEGIDNLRQLMCDTLAKANESGALEAVLRDCNKVDGKSVKKSDIDDMRRVIVDALGDGSLERGLREAMAAAPVLAGGAAAAGGKEGTSAKESEALRTYSRDMLGEESLNGTLEENLKFSSTRVEDDLDDTRSKVRNMLSQAAADGSLERAFKCEEVVLLLPEAKQNVHLDSANGAPKEEDLQVRKILEQPVASGNLQKVSETQDNQDRDPASEDARLKILESLITANRDGSLGKALETLACKTPPPGPKIDSQGIREKARTILTQDTVDGNFGRVFEELRCQQPDEPEVEDIRKKVSGILEAACVSGALEEAFKDLSSPKAQDESLASTRTEMSDVLSQVLASGSLEGAVAGGSAPAREQEVPKEMKVVEALSTLGNAQEDKPTRMDALRLETSRMYTLEDGCLEKALRTTVQDTEDMCPRAFDALVAANDSGALEAAMRRLSSQRSAESPPSKHLPLTPQAPSKPHTGQIRPSGRARSEVAYPANSGAVWVLSEVRKRDGRVGELVSMIRETERQIEDRIRQCRWLDERLDSTRADVAHIALDIEWHKCALENAIERSSELEATQGKLKGELEGQQMKLRSTEGTLPSARSNTSTEASGFDATTSSMGTTMSWSRMPLSTRSSPGTLDSFPLCR